MDADTGKQQRLDPRGSRHPASAQASHSPVLRNFLALGLGEALARLAAFAATAYLARQLGPAMYGIIGVVSGVMLYFAQVADGGIELTGVPAIARARDSVVAIASPLLAVRIAVALALAVLLAIAGLWLLPQPDGAVLAASGLALIFTAASTRWIHLGLERTGWIAIARTAGEVLALVLVVALVHGPGDIGLVPVATFAGAAVTALLLAEMLRRQGFVFPMRLDWPAARPVFVRSRHIVGFTLLGLLLFNFDLIFLRIVTGASAAGQYAAAYTLISFSANLIVAYAHTLMPALSRLDDDLVARDALYQTATAHAFAVALPVAVGGQFVAGHIIALVFGPAYEPAVLALQWLLWTVPLAAMREIPVVALIASGGERALFRLNGVTAASNVALNVALVPRYGLLGAAIATVATEILRLVLAALVARTAGYQIVGVRRLWKAAAASAAMAAALALLRPSSLWVALLLGVGAYAVALLLVGAVRLAASRRLELRV